MDITQETITLLRLRLESIRRQVGPVRKYRAGRNCQKGYNCGGSCITRRKNCRKALEGEAKNFSDWMVQKMSANIGGVLGDAPKDEKKSALPNWMRGEPIAESLASGQGKTIATGYYIGTGTIESVNPPSEEYPSGSIRVKNKKGEQDTFNTYDLRDKIKRGEARLVDNDEPDIKLGAKSTKEMGDRELVESLSSPDLETDAAGRELSKALSEYGTDSFSRAKILELTNNWIVGGDESGWENATEEFESRRFTRKNSARLRRLSFRQFTRTLK